MIRFQSLANIEDRVSPILMLELRQATRNRFVMFAIAVLLIALLGASAYMLFVELPGTGLSEFGKDYFNAIYAVLFATAYFFIPLYTSVRLNVERIGNGMEIFSITNLTASNILLGKMGTACALILLFFGLSAPFLAMSYILRGIDLFTVYGVILLSVIMIIGGTYWALFWGSIPGPIVMRICFFALGISGLGLSFLGILEAVQEIQTTGLMDIISNVGFWFLSIVLLVLWGFGSFIAHSVSVSSIQTNADRRATLNELYDYELE